jgi:hypothetical protein
MIMRSETVPAAQVTAYFASKEMAESAAENLRQRGLLAAADIVTTEGRVPPAYGLLARFVAAGALLGAIAGGAGGALFATRIDGGIDPLWVSLVAGLLLGTLGALGAYAIAESRIATRNEKMGSRLITRLISSTESTKRVKRLLRDQGAYRVVLEH